MHFFNINKLCHSKHFKTYVEKVSKENTVGLKITLLQVLFRKKQ